MRMQPSERMLTMPHPPLPLPSCPNCTRPQRGRDLGCVCGHRFPTPDPLRIDDYTRLLGLREVRRARRTLAVARAMHQLANAT